MEILESTRSKALLYLCVVPGLLMLKWIVTAIYNIYFHPLSKYPGPKLAAASKLVYRYNSFIGNERVWATEAHEKYGEVVRLGPNNLSYISPLAWKDITGHRTNGRKENSKDTKEFFRPEHNGLQSMIGLEDVDEHTRLRKIFNSAFSDKALKQQEGLIRGYVNKLLHNIYRDVDSPLDAVKLYNCTAFDIMGDLTFGEPLGMLETSEYTPWVRAVFANIKSSTLARAMQFYPWLGAAVKMLQPKSLRELSRSHFMHSADRVDSRLARGNDIGKADIWQLVLEKGKDRLSLPQMHANASLFMIAGTETTATSLSGLTYYLLTNSSKLQKLLQEVRSLTSEQLNLDELQKQPYLNACVDEGLRMYPPIPNGFPRRVPKGGNIICGDFVPEDTQVRISQYAAFHSPLNFRNPDSFIPERWLPGSGYDSDRKEVAQPFSSGPRNCIGKNLAYHEIRLVIATILWHFDLELCSESLKWSQQKTYALWEKPPLLVRFKQIRLS